MFSSDPVPREAIELAIMTASTAPSGAHQQPWAFVAIADPGLKHQIRIAVEEEERRSYEGGRMRPVVGEAPGSDRHLFGHGRDTVARLSPYADPSDEDVR